MPRTTTLECLGRPPLRALTFDALGLIKVVEARSKQGTPKLVEGWGEPDSAKCVVAVSVNDCKSDRLLAVARKSGQVEVLNPVNGDLQTAIFNAIDTDVQSEENALVGSHLFAKHNLELTSRYCTLLSCTEKGNASIKCIQVMNSSSDSVRIGSSRDWNVCAGGNILCCKVDGSEKYGLFGGKGVEVNLWDLDNCTEIWNAKPVCLYDISAQRRPVLSLDFCDTPIKVVAEDIDGYSIYIGNGSGDLATVDIRTGKLLGCLMGKCSGSIRSIATHPKLPVIASCGLDCYLQFWDTKTRQLLSAVFLKQHLMHVVFYSNFTAEEIVPGTDQLLSEEQNMNEITPVEEFEALPLKRKGTSKSIEHNMDTKERKRKSKKIEAHKYSKGIDQIESIDNIKERDKDSKSKLKEKSKRSKSEIQD